ncbi:MAG: hypothetical protein KatS3mg089_0579 [Patescibacteria group bacterium]|nr:MAG: hypothetical protein KatS3mg089_0579 [Patescibacteria group bacterium]
MGKENLRGESTKPQDLLHEGPKLTHRFYESINIYLQDAQRNGVLRPHQRDVFESFQRFFQEGYTRGFIELPTGTGKTVLFVELSKALLNTDPSLPRPKILVVTPTKDLVQQIMGRTGEKGYGKFAPELKVGSFFSDTPDKEKTEEALDMYDVVVTTYNSFSILNKRNEYRPITDTDKQLLLQEYQSSRISEYIDKEEIHHLVSSIKYIPTGRNLLNKFDVFILDEAHHTLGVKTGSIVNSLPPNKVILGFTATPDASQQKKLIHYLPEKIHSLELNEAIWLGLLAPIVPIGIKSGIHIRGSNLYDDSGDFIDSRIRYLAEDPKRNRLIIEAAKSLTQHGIGTVISCIAGNEAWHARYLAEKLEREGVRAVAVHRGVPSQERQEIYQQFEKGEIDVLTFIGVLSEGWDSYRAKAMIGARPTRSIIFSKQRVGRITRPGGIAFAIDIWDEYEDKNPAINVADILNEGDIPLGSTVGIAEDRGIIQQVIASLTETTPLMTVLPSNYKNYEELLSDLDVLNKGVLVSYDRKQTPEWAIASRITSTYSGVTDEIFAKIEELKGIKISKKLARQGNSIRTVYSVNQAKDLLYKLPKIDPRKYFIDEKGVKRISPEGLVVLFGKRYPNLNLEIVQEQLEKIEDQLDWIPACYQLTREGSQYRNYKVIKIYNAEQKTIDLLNQALSEYFQQTLLDKRQI